MDLRRIIRNSLVLFSKEILLNLLAIFTVGFMARKLGAIDYGKFSYALSFANLISIISNLGVRQYVTREIVRRKSRERIFYGKVIFTRLVLSGFMVIIGLITAFILHHNFTMVLLVLIAIISKIFFALTTSNYIIFEAHEEMQYNALTQSISRLSVITLVILALLSNFGLFTIILIYLLGDFFQYAISYIIVTKKFFKPTLIVNWKAAADLVRKSLPFALYSIFYLMYFEIDKLMLYQMKDAASVGVYQAAVVLAYKVLILSDAVGTAIFPRIVAYGNSEPEKYKKLTFLSVGLMLLLGIISALTIFWLAHWIINIIYHSAEYDLSVQILRVIIWVLPFMFVTKIFSFLLIAKDHQNTLAGIYFLIVLVNIGTNLILIPSHGAIGAAVATLLSESFGMALFLFFYNKMGLKIA